MPFEGGPYVQAACLCNMALEDKTGTISLIRIVDRLVIGSQGPNPPESLPLVPQVLTLVIMLKSGTATGRYDLTVQPEFPNGETKAPVTFSVHFEGEERGHNVILQMSMVFPLEGLYWFNVDLDGERLTRIPLRVMYNRVIATSP